MTFDLEIEANNMIYLPSAMQSYKQKIKTWNQLSESILIEKQ